MHKTHGGLEWPERGRYFLIRTDLLSKNWVADDAAILLTDPLAGNTIAGNSITGGKL
jgi:hypothetical protein